MPVTNSELLSELCERDDVPLALATYWTQGKGLRAIPTRNQTDWLVCPESWRGFVRNYRHGCKNDPDFPTKALDNARANSY